MIPFSPPRIDEKVADAVREVLLSGWITTGPRTKEFERQLQAYSETKRVICLNSWTNAVELFLRWYGIGKGDEVIIPAYTYTASANVFDHVGAKIVMADVGEDFLMGPQQVSSLITDKTRLIMPVDIGGLPADYKGLLDLIESVKSLFSASNEKQEQLGRILLLSDAAHSVGATIDGSPAARFSDVSGYSFHAVKNLTTAEGGALTFNFPDGFDHDQLYQDLNIKSLHGQSKDALSKTQAGAWKYDVHEAGYKCNMTDIQAAIGLIELERYERETLPRRKKLSAQYSELLSPYEWANLPRFKLDGRESSYHLFMVRIEGASEEQRDAIISHIAENGVSTNVHFQPLPLLSYYKGLGYKMSDYPKAFSSYANEISLPLYYDLKEEQVETVVDTLKKAVKSVLG